MKTVFAVVTVSDGVLSLLIAYNDSRQAVDHAYGTVPDNR